MYKSINFRERPSKELRYRKLSLELQGTSVTLRKSESTMVYVEDAVRGGKGEILERERGARKGREEGTTFSMIHYIASRVSMHASL